MLKVSVKARVFTHDSKQKQTTENILADLAGNPNRKFTVNDRLQIYCKYNALS